ncbi:hypothetical protein DVK05_11450 [Halorubrum sp. Atlit-8R]|uniref:hypothetical protein n=1 Tax=unclassified Halorubrum TaxID=2642239 RepID=UPI000EF2615A|nr:MULTISPECIES: hypothetical protein [unclassified Halorubrum]RLM67337.1 hypothetical protein DVK08_11515 [Halorubrum sp. Atlit-9R]RLM77497.1 hypothetical protein DVK05_11450 [Halorubrum sp. Atlit-8R]
MTDRHRGPDRGARDAPGASAALGAGAALFNERRFLAARDAWNRGRRPDNERDGADERLLRALAATAAATHRAADGDRAGAAAEADDAAAALRGVADARDVALAPVREWVDRLAADPGGADPASAPRIRVDGEAPTVDGLSLAAAGVAAPALATAGEPGDPETLATAAAFAREERGTGRTEFAELLFAYLRTPDARPQVAARLGDHVDREERKRRDVDGLF